MTDNMKIAPADPLDGAGHFYERAKREQEAGDGLPTDSLLAAVGYIVRHLQKQHEDPTPKGSFGDLPADLKMNGPDLWRVVSSARSKMEGWAKVTRVMDLSNGGCIVNAITTTRAGCSESLAFVPDCSAESILNHHEASQ